MSSLLFVRTELLVGVLSFFVELPFAVVALIAAVLELGAVSPISISVISSC